MRCFIRGWGKYLRIIIFRADTLQNCFPLYYGSIGELYYTLYMLYYRAYVMAYRRTTAVTAARAKCSSLVCRITVVVGGRSSVAGRRSSVSFRCDVNRDDVTASQPAPRSPIYACWRRMSRRGGNIINGVQVLLGDTNAAGSMGRRWTA